MIERICHDGIELALIIRHSFRADGIEFFTPDEYSQQIGYMNRSRGYIIPPHVHNPVTRKVHFTREVLFIKSGKVRMDLYNDRYDYIESAIVESGDIILLANGGHGFEMLEDSEIFEVKQGPYAGDGDKTRFEPVGSSRLIIKSIAK